MMQAEESTSEAEAPKYDEAVAPKFEFEFENRHKRVVSDPPPLESWHTSGKL